MTTMEKEARRSMSTKFKCPQDKRVIGSIYTSNAPFKILDISQLGWWNNDTEKGKERLSSLSISGTLRPIWSRSGPGASERTWRPSTAVSYVGFSLQDWRWPRNGRDVVGSLTRKLLFICLLWALLGVFICVSDELFVSTAFRENILHRIRIHTAGFTTDVRISKHLDLTHMIYSFIH